MLKCVKALVVLVSLVGVPAAAYAQASIVGTARDASGAVIPGVTVEASSPALIEKTRSVVTNATGQYAIEDLRPGTYTVSFSLTGFNMVVRSGRALDGISRVELRLSSSSTLSSRAPSTVIGSTGSISGSART